MNPVEELYRDALDADLLYCGKDLSVPEGNAALEGPDAWLALFPAHEWEGPPHASRHAGLHGHRWGWLIRRKSWVGFCNIVAKPPAERLRALAAEMDRTGEC